MLWGKCLHFACSSVVHFRFDSRSIFVLLVTMLTHLWPYSLKTLLFISLLGRIILNTSLLLSISSSLTRTWQSFVLYYCRCWLFFLFASALVRWVFWLLCLRPSLGPRRRIDNSLPDIQWPRKSIQLIPFNLWEFYYDHIQLPLLPFFVFSVDQVQICIGFW